MAEWSRGDLGPESLGGFWRGRRDRICSECCVLGLREGNQDLGEQERIKDQPAFALKFVPRP